MCAELNKGNGPGGTYAPTDLDEVLAIHAIADEWFSDSDAQVRLERERMLRDSCMALYPSTMPSPMVLSKTMNADQLSEFQKLHYPVRQLHMHFFGSTHTLSNCAIRFPLTD